MPCEVSRSSPQVSLCFHSQLSIADLPQLSRSGALASQGSRSLPRTPQNKLYTSEMATHFAFKPRECCSLLLRLLAPRNFETLKTISSWPDLLCTTLLA
jgi:hypothetical protein